jgi:glycosyltransferase involved in cell wall biosynthesis
MSVVIANYNNSDFLREALDSLRKQSVTSWEAIIVDDGSDQRNRQLLRSLTASDRRVRVVELGKRTGVGNTKRVAVENAIGNIVGVLDPDDALRPDAVAIILEAHARHPTASLIWTDYFLCDADLTPNSESTSHYEGDNEQGYLLHEPGSIHAFWSFKRFNYNQTSGFDSRFVLAEDQDLFLKLEEVGKTVYLPGPLYYYRIHDRGISTGVRTAEAFGWHLLAMSEALRRRKNRLDREQYRLQRNAVLEHWAKFADWGLSKVSVSLSLKLLRRSVADFSREEFASRYYTELPRRFTNLQRLVSR